MKKFEAPKVTCIEVVTELLITASKLGIPTVSPQPFSYSAKEFSRLYNDHEPWVGAYNAIEPYDILLYKNTYFVLRKDYPNPNAGEHVGLEQYVNFKPYYEYIGCYKYKGDAGNFVYGGKYHLYMKDNEYYFLPCY
jgi:hypothetical protein